MLANNNVKELADLEGLTRCSRLAHIVLSENPVTRKEVRSTAFIAGSDSLQHYRLYMIWSIPSLRFLDYKRVRATEREDATGLFGSLKEPTELATKIKGVQSKTIDAATTNGRTPAASSGKVFRAVLSETEKKRVQEMLQNAKSMAEIDRIEKDLAEGRIPKGAADADRAGS